MKHLLYLLFFLASYAYAQNPQLNATVRNNTLSPARVANALDGSIAFTASGTNTYTITTGLPVYASSATYANGDIWNIVTTNANSSGTITLNVDSEGAVSVKDQEGNDLEVGDFKAGGTYTLRHNGTHFRVINIGGGGGASVVGAQDLFITAAAMWPRSQNGSSTLTPVEMATSLLTVQSLDFDQAEDQYAQFTFSLPRNWNNGTITATVYWTAAAGSGTVEWEIAAVAYSNDDPFSGTFGTAVEIDDTLITINDLHTTPTSSAITIAGTPADGDLIALQIMRDVSDDTLSADAKLLGIRLTITLDATTSE